MRIEFLTPADGLEAQKVRDMMLLAGADVPESVVSLWTELEMALAFDWAAREHFSVSDVRIGTRGKPWFVRATETGNQRESLRDIIIQFGPHGVSMRKLNEVAAGRGISAEQVLAYLMAEAAEGRAKLSAHNRWVALTDQDGDGS